MGEVQIIAVTPNTSGGILERKQCENGLPSVVFRVYGNFRITQGLLREYTIIYVTTSAAE